MAIKSSNKNVVAFDKYAAEAATGSDKPYFLMVKHAALAAHEGAIGDGDRDAFYARLERARASQTHKTMLDNRKSEAWSAVKLGFEYKHCLPAIFAAMEKVAPTPTGLYDIVCSIRGKAQFAEKGECKGKAINLPEVSAVAPSEKQMTESMKAMNAYRNGLSGTGARPLDKMLASYVKMLIAFRDGKRDPKTGKPAKNGKGESITLPVIASKELGNAIAALDAFKTELVSGNGKVVKLRPRKAAAA